MVTPEQVAAEHLRIFAIDPGYSAIPTNTLAGLMNYHLEGVPTGDFLRAVLSGDLFGAMGRADARNKQALSAICMYVANQLPAVCWGGPNAVEQWIKHKADERRLRP